MTFNSVITVLSARRYSFTNETSGEIVAGVKLQYVEDWNGEDKQNSKGCDILSATLPLSVWDKLMSGPCDYNAHFKMTQGAKGRPMLSIVGLDYVQNFKPISAKVSPNK